MVPQEIEHEKPKQTLASKLNLLLQMPMKIGRYELEKARNAKLEIVGWDVGIGLSLMGIAYSLAASNALHFSVLSIILVLLGFGLYAMSVTEYLILRAERAIEFWKPSITKTVITLAMLVLHLFLYGMPKGSLFILALFLAYALLSPAVELIIGLFFWYIEEVVLKKKTHDDAF